MNNDILEKMYPSMGPATPAPAAAAPDSVAARMYPSMGQTAPVPRPAEPSPAAVPVQAPAATATPSTVAPETAEVIANRMFPYPATRGFVNWQEGESGPGDIRLEQPIGWTDDQAAQADRQAIADAMASQGVGRSLATELWRDISQAATQPVTTTETEARAELQRIWGRETDSKIALARAAIDAMERQRPGTKQFLADSGLGNDVNFVRKVVIAAGRKAGR